MTIALDKPVGQSPDGLLKADIKWLVSQLPHEIFYDYQEIDQSEHLLWDTRNYHYQLTLHDDGHIVLLKCPYLQNGNLGQEQEIEIVLLPQFVALLEV